MTSQDPPRKKRHYHSPLREQRARETRELVADTATDVFAELGYISTTMQTIAERAGVSVELVHSIGRKPDLLQRSFAEAVEVDAAVRLLDDQALAAAISSGDRQTVVARVVELTKAAGDRSARLWRAADVCVQSTPSFTEHLAIARRQRLAGCRRLVDEIGLDDVALDLAAITAPEIRLQMTEDLGMTDDIYLRWVHEAVTRLFAEDPRATES